jgi:uncharacterized heparinase superfamily protein
MSRRRGAGLDAKTTAWALLRLTGRRLSAEWRATPFYGLALAGPKPDGLVITPRDSRPVDAELGRQILLGRMTLAGATLEIGVGGDPWDIASPTRAFAVELHRFAWLPSLLAQGPEGAVEALRLTLDWQRLFGKVTPFAWGAETLERRVFNLACGLRRVTERASELEAAGLMEALARQTRHLMRLDSGPMRRAERLAVAALPKLDHALSIAVLPDGGLKSRSPEQGLELLFDLLALDNALMQRGREAPLTMAHAIDRLTQATRFFTLGDGRLAAFQGGEAVDARRVNAALAHDDGGGHVQPALPYAGYQRLSGRTLLVMADAAAPTTGAWSLAACAQPLAIEVTCGGDRLIANSGWSPEAQGPQALRLTDGASTASLGDASAGHPLTGFLTKGLGPRLVDGPRQVDASRQENEAGLWLELIHDGWVERFGLLHERRLFLDPRLDELRGEDCFERVEGAAPVARPAHGYAVHFHLPPEVQVSLARDKRSVLLRGPSNRGWWFRNDAPDVHLETSTYFHDRHPRRAAQIVLKGPVSGDGARVRWKLTPVDPTDPRSGLAGAAATLAKPQGAPR